MTTDFAPDIWQEYDCPATGLDFDLDGAQILIAGESFNCAGCRGTHTAGIDGPTHTALRFRDGSEEYRGLPESAEQRSVWMREIELQKTT